MKTTWILVLATVMSVWTVSAQPLTPQQKKQAKERVNQQRNRPDIDLNTEPSSAPEAEMTVQEFALKRTEMQGKVVELEFDHVISLQQTRVGFEARLTYESVRVAEGLTVLIPEDGLAFFEPLAAHRGPLRKTVYVEVVSGEMVRALGTRYSKNKPEGERYRW